MDLGIVEWPKNKDMNRYQRTVKGMRCCLTCRLTNEPETISWLLTEDTDSSVKGKVQFITAVAVARGTSFLPLPQFSQGDTMNARYECTCSVLL